MSHDLIQYSRQTYSVLDWLGDIGGLFGAIVSIGNLVSHSYQELALQSMLMSLIFRFKPENKDEVKETNTYICIARGRKFVRQFVSKQTSLRIF